MQIVTGRRGEPHVTSRQMQAVYRSFLGDFALLDIGEKLRAEAYSDDIVRVYDGVVSVQGIYAVIAYNQYDEVYIEPVSVGKKRIDTIVLHYTKDNALDVEDMQLDVVQGEEYTDNPIAPVVPAGGDAWEGTTDIQVPIYDVEVTNFGLTVTPYARMLNLIPTLESIAERIPETVVTGVKGDSEVLYRDGDVNITKANIGLGNVDNTADTDKPISTATQTALNLKADLTYVDAKISAAYHAGGNLTVAELTSALLITENMGKVYNMSDSGVTTSDFVEGAGKPIHEGDNVGICNVGTEESPVYKFDLLSGFVDLSAYATTSAVNAGLAGKVDKVDGKGLSTNDYTTTEKTKLAGISEGATQTIANPADTATETLSKVEIEGTVYDIPQGASGATELSELTDVNLLNVEDGDILQYDETANKWKNSNALQGAKTATGNPITVTDAAPVNAVNLSMDLEPIQDLHGYDHPWVGGAGKNKLPPFTSTTVQGVTIAVNAQGAVTLNGTATGNGNINIGASLKAGTYKISGAYGNSDFYKSETMGNNNRMYIYDGSSNYFDNVSGGREFTLSQDTTCTVYLVFVSGYTFNNSVIYPMIRLSTETDSTFAPYSNICPISGRSGVAIDRVGKNLFNQNYYNSSTLWSMVTYSSMSQYFIYAPLPSNFPRKFSATSFLKTSSAISDCVIGFATSTDFTSGSAVERFVQRGVNTTTDFDFTGEDNLYLILGKSSGNIDATTYPSTVFSAYNVMITLPNRDLTTYEPYQGKTYTIQLGDTVYGAHHDVTRGKMVVDRYIKQWQWSDGYQSTSLGNNTRKIFNVNGNYVHAKTNNNSICDCLISESSSSTDTPHYTISMTNEYQIFVILPNDTPNDFTFDICYELATPFTIPLTPQQIKMLENTNTIYTDYEGDTIHIEYQPNNAIGEAVRIVEESYDPEFAVRPVLKKKAFSGTTDSDGSVTLINASDIPSGHKIIPLQITDMTIDGSAGTYFVEYEPYNSGDAVKGYCYFYMSGSQMFPVGKAITGNFYYYELEV